MGKRNTLAGARLLFGLLALVALVAQLVVHIRHRFDVVNFFSYFTNLSNLFAAVVLLFGAASLVQHRELTAARNIVRGAAVVAIAVVGIVFSVLLRDDDLGQLLPWVNFVLHYLMPVIVVADWLYLPPKETLGVRQIAFWLIYPLL